MPKTSMQAVLMAVMLAMVPAALAASGATRVVLYAPYGIDGRLGSEFTATARARGSCWTSSLSSARPDAWRCTAGNSIHDPCVSNPAGTEVACSSDPFQKAVLIIDLDKALPARHAPSGSALDMQRLLTNGDPWGLRLANGATCFFITGATGVIGGMRLNYGCTAKGGVIGNVDRSTQPWRAFYTPDLQNGGYIQVEVSEAIF